VALVPPSKGGHALTSSSKRIAGASGSTGTATTVPAGVTTTSAATVGTPTGGRGGAAAVATQSTTGGGGVAPATRVGVSRTGVACTTGALQFSWSPYAPGCQPAFTANNGGATSQGVTGSTINLSYREPNSNEEATVASLAGSAFPNDPAFIADLQTYIRYFNTQFELYGRKVVLTPFQGQGDYLEEDQGQDLAGAQADAATAQSQGAFADVPFSLFSSQFYAQDLAEDHVVSYGGLGYTNQWFEQYAPYEFSETPTGTSGASGFVQLACDRMAGLPAEYAGES
jgi:hypothetical protein